MPSLNQNKTGRDYWRSLDELADSPAFREQAEGEFAKYAPEQVIQSPTRRAMLKLMGASMALAGAGSLSGCRRWPEKQLAPYTQRPEDRIPGLPEFYATAMELGGVAQPLLVSSYDGRPIKIEGNPDHPFSRGAATAFAQASVLEMYDPDRSRNVLHKQAKSSWVELEKAVAELNLAASKGEGFAILSEASGSSTVADLRARLKQSLPAARWYEYESVSFDHEISGAKIAFGKPLRPQLHLDKAEFVVSLDADILWGHPASLKYARDFAKGRKSVDAGKMNRLYSVEGSLTLTGMNADRRLPLAPGKILEFAKALCVQLGVSGVSAGATLDEKSAKFAADVAADLKSAMGRGVVTAGPGQPAEVHAAAAMINAVLGNLNKTVSYIAVEDRPTHVQAITALAEALNKGAVKTLLVIGGNPVFDAPANLKFAEAIAKAEKSFHVSSYNNETSRACQWHLPRSHYLEAWGDVTSWDGGVSVTQPLIVPLFDTRSAIEVLALFSGDSVKSGHELVRRTFGQWIGAETFERGWRKVLHQGMLPGSEAKAVATEIAADAAGKVNAATSKAAEWELQYLPDYSTYDGRFANNGWLQELPDPITKLVWDNAALVGPADATRLGVNHGDMIQVKAAGGTVELPVYVLPGQASGTIGVSLGYGRVASGYVGDKVGFDVQRVRTSDAMHAAVIEKPTKVARKYSIVTTQDHHAIDQLGKVERETRVQRDLVRVAPLDFFEKNRDFAHHMGIHTPTMEQGGRHVPLQIFEDPVDFEKEQPNGLKLHRWAMAIDLSSCIGCSACVVACQAENNVPIVGKEQVAVNREMHWIRIDRYFAGDENDPRVVQQPVTCHQCETAPCEQVCPAAATVHDSEGLNVMIYNRCIGTRYCSNNCPFKVRRFNYFDWQTKPVKGSPSSGMFLGLPDQQLNQVDPVRRLGFNPEVTVRMRGVMEKCTFCVQRIKAKTIPALNEFRQGKRANPYVTDGAITPACAQTCPTEAIVFGNLNDKSSRVAQLFEHDRAYEMLEEVNVRARMRYMAKVYNPGSGHGFEPPVRKPHAAKSEEKAAHEHKDGDGHDHKH